MYLGNQPALSYTSFAKQDFSTSATTTYTLDNPVANANELALFINFVRQEPTTAYSASGTTLTLTSATSASDDMYCVYLGKAVQTVNPPNASVGASQIVDSSIALGKLSATGTKDATTFLRGDNTFSVPAGGTNTPAFHAVMSADQTGLSNNVFHKVAFNTKVFDTTGNEFDTTNNRWTPTVTGKYVISFHLRTDNSTYVHYFEGRLTKNGSLYSESGSRYNNYIEFNESLNSSRIIRAYNPQISRIITVTSTSDYYEVQGYNYNAGSFKIAANQSYFGAYKIIE